METFELSKGIIAVDLALYLAESKTLVIADTHIGYEEALNKQGVFVPRFQFKDIGKRLEKIFAKLSDSGRTVEKIIINGDVKHEFGTISEQEWRHTLQLIDFLNKHCKDLYLIKGNHDKILGPIAGKRSIEIKDYLILGDIAVMHGDRLPDKKLEAEMKDKKVKTIIIGHEHPAVSLGTMARFERYKCFLAGKWKRKALIVQPSFNLVTEGTDVIKEKLLSPFLKQNSGFKNFEVIVPGEDEKFYDFGKIGKLR